MKIAGRSRLHHSVRKRHLTNVSRDPGAAPSIAQKGVQGARYREGDVSLGSARLAGVDPDQGAAGAVNKTLAHDPDGGHRQAGPQLDDHGP